MKLSSLTFFFTSTALISLNFFHQFFPFFFDARIFNQLTSQNGFIFDCMMKGNLHNSQEFVSEAVSHCWKKSQQKNTETNFSSQY